MVKIAVPKEVAEIVKTLAAAGFEAYLVGGCVRDILLDREPKDWDVTTNARPEEIQKLFPESVYENQFGTVGVKTDADDPKLKVVEATTYRIEGRYSDQRHPDEVKFAETLKEDLSRRDFTVNALAMDPKGDIVDPFGGKADLKARAIRTVGGAEQRFGEDALRLLRAVRLSAELDFEIDMETRRAIEAKSRELDLIAKERVRDELVKMLMTPRAAKGIILLEELGLLQYVLPELRDGIGVSQNKHHVYSVFEHSVRALDYAAKQNYSLEVRMASLLHDVGKPRAKQGEGPDATFYQHEYIGAKMAARALDRLRFPKDFVERVAHLVRRHMFNYEVDVVSPAGVRRFIARVGLENIDDLIKVREADRIGSGVEKAVPYKLRHLLFMVEKVRRDPILPKMLAVRGEDVMEMLGIPQSPRVGLVLYPLLEEVLDDPSRNTKEYLVPRVKELGKLSDGELKKMAAAAKKRKSEFEEEEEGEIKKKYYVK